MSDGNVKPPTAEAVIEAYSKLTEQRAALKAKYDEVDGVLKDKQQKCKAFLLKQMELIGSSQLKGSKGVAYKETKKRYSTSDWPQTWAFIKENDRFDMLQKRLSESTLTEYFEEHGELPAGVNMYQENVVIIRKS